MTAARPLTWTQVRARRLARNHLLERAGRARLVDVVRDVGGIQAQMMGAAELALAARVDGLTQQDVREELWERRRLVKGYSVRGTLHLLPADELPLWTAAMTAEPYWRTPAWQKRHGLTATQVERLLDALGEALDGRCLTRDELDREVARRAGRWAEGKFASAWNDVLGPAFYAGIVCYGPPQGTRVTFVRPDQWLGDRTKVEPTDALVRVLRRFLAAYGPAKPGDFAEWSSCGRAEARELFDALGDELEAVDVEGYRAFVLAADGEFPTTSRRDSVRLVPQYDTYVIGSRQRDSFVPPAARERLRTHPKGRLEGPASVAWLLVDGGVAGLWERRRRGRRVEISVEPLTRLDSRRRRALEAEAARVGVFLGADVELAVA